MKITLLTSSLIALLLVSTAVLADGRLTGIRIGRAASNDNNVEIDVTATATDIPWNTFSTTLELGNRWASDYPGFSGIEVWVYASSSFNVPFPYAIDWGDGDRGQFATLFGPPGGPWVGTFSHTYSPGSYTITVGDSTGSGPVPNTGNGVYGSSRYIYCVGCVASPFTGYSTFTYGGSLTILAITNTAMVTTGAGIPTLNIYGLLGMAFVLAGAGLLLYRKPTVA